MKRQCIVLVLIISLVACKSNSDSGYHLPPKEMGRLLLDVHIAEAYGSVIRKDSAHLWTTRNYDSLTVFYKDIFAHYNVTQDQFLASLNWYRQHPAELDSIYEKMIPEASKLEMKSKIVR